MRIDRATGEHANLGKALFAIMVVIFTLLVCLFPIKAFADYTNASVNITASVQSNGSIRIVEQRAIGFDEPYSGISFRFTGLPSDAELEVMSVRLAPMEGESIAGDWVSLPQDSFQSGWREAFGNERALTSEQAHLALEKALSESANSLIMQDGTWALDELNDSLYVFYPFAGKMLVEVDVAISNAVFVYDDVAELYWDYISENPSAQTDDVNVVVQLPVAEGAQIIPSDNVLAWGHGPEGSVSITTGGTIEYSVAKVLPGQYAQAHILFPRSWLTNLPREMEMAFSGTRRDVAIALERAWTDTWSNSRVNGLIVDITAIALSVMMIVAAIILYLVFGRCRPSDRRSGKTELMNVNPAVIGRLMRWDHISADDLVACLIRLQDKGALQIDRVTTDDASLFGAPYGDLVIRMKPSGKSKLVSDVEKEAMRILFGVFADGYQKISVNEILRFSRKNPEAFRAAIAGWQETLSSEVDELGLFDRKSFKVRKAMMLTCIVLVVISLISGFSGWTTPALALFVAAACIGVLGNYTMRKGETGIALTGEIERISHAIWEEASVQGQTIERYIAYLFAAGMTGGLYDRIEDPTMTENMWFAPVVGRGGKLMVSCADRLSDVLDKAVQGIDER